MSSELIIRIRRLVIDGGMSRSGLARAAGLHANTLRDMTEQSWNPTADTLAKLERQRRILEEEAKIKALCQELAMIC